MRTRLGFELFYLREEWETSEQGERWDESIVESRDGVRSPEEVDRVSYAVEDMSGGTGGVEVERGRGEEDLEVAFGPAFVLEESLRESGGGEAEKGAGFRV